MKQQINGNNPIRVLHMAPIRMGGITELVLTLSEKIDFEKVQFDYLTFEDTFDQASKRAKEAHSTIYRVDLQTVKNPIVRGLKKFFGIIKLVHSEQIKIIHINSSTPYEVLVAFAAKIGGAKKIIYHSHNSSYYPGQKLVKLSEVFKWFMPFVITDYLACSDAAARFMFPKKIVDAENYTVIKNGVDYDKHSFKPEVRTELRKKYGLENNFVLGHVGRFNVQKNHEFLIDIFYEVYKHDNSARLFLVGIGETENQIKEKVVAGEFDGYFEGENDELEALFEKVQYGFNSAKRSNVVKEKEVLELLSKVEVDLRELAHESKTDKKKSRFSDMLSKVSQICSISVNAPKLWPLLKDAVDFIKQFLHILEI